MSKHYFIGDTHFGHSNIHMKFRPEFNSVEEHNETIHQNILNTGNKCDCLWLLGDIFFKEVDFYRLSAYAKKFNQVYYVLGNHDSKSAWRYAAQHKNISILGVEQRWGLWISHVPIPEYELYRGNSVHGHMHSKNVGHAQEWDNEGRYALLPEEQYFVEDTRYFCTSCEQVGYKPISLDQIKEIRNWK
jgi:calcineurin-like phosphoesterase family protein